MAKCKALTGSAVKGLVLVNNTKLYHIYHRFQAIEGILVKL